LEEPAASIFRDEIISILMEVAGYAVAQLVQALRYKPEGRGSITDGGHCDFH
jgi:hypothetical protein